MKKVRRFYRRFDEDHSGLINLTPLIDVVFVVLIMFIIVAPLLKVDHVELVSNQSQEKKMASSPAHEGIAIYVRKDNTIWFNTHPVNVEELRFLLRQFYTKSPEAVPQVFHDKHAYFETYQIVKESIEAAGFHEMDVILKSS